jgi:asparagine synthase (glutamine-hydrolysing)
MRSVSPRDNWVVVTQVCRWFARYRLCSKLFAGGVSVIHARRMCGIAAYFAPDHVEHGSMVDLVASKLRHRGPHRRASDRTGRAAVAQAGNSLVTLSAQPMRSNDERLLMVFGGKIYNYRALHTWLKERYEFKTNSDAEVVLPLYDELGPSCAGELDGMFAFFVSDGNRFTAARDAFGIKPLYFGSALGGLLFASEQKALADWCVNFQALPPGSYVTETGTVRRWFNPAWPHQAGNVSCVGPDSLARRLEQAVAKRLRGEASVGVFLSGGLDSSVIAEIASRHCDALATFSAGFEGASDLAAARIAAKALGTRHLECVFSVADAVNALEGVIYHLESYDTEAVRSAIPFFFLSRAATEHVRVILTGEGADELFGGYDHFADLDPPLVHQECVKLLLGLHSMNLQRLDRMTMAHGIEARVPFLDVGLVEWVMSINPRLKAWGGRVPEKLLLRAAFHGRLPQSILRRSKVDVSRGSGADRALLGYANAKISDRELRRAGTRFPRDTPVTKEQYLYRSIFENLFPGETWRSSVARWRPGARTLAAS